MTETTGATGQGDRTDSRDGGAHLRMLDAVVNGLFHVGLSLQDALELPGDSGRKRVEEALDDLDDVIREIRGAVIAPRGCPPAPPVAAGGKVVNQVVSRWPARGEHERGDAGRRPR
jgi:hypothetical protein